MMNGRTKRRTPVQLARERAGLSMLQLAARAGIALETLRKAERYGDMSETTRRKIAQALGEDVGAQP